jgi:hypothetical protein
MMGVFLKQLKPNGPFLLSVLLFSFLLASLPVTAQEKPPRPIAVSKIQNLSFGAFSQGNLGGTVTINPYGARYFTGDIILFLQVWQYFPAIFEIEGNRGTVVHLVVVHLSTQPLVDAYLNGASLTIYLGNYIPGDPIILNTSPPGQMQVTIGGTLTDSNPSANPPGSYTGLFSLMFIQE